MILFVHAIVLPITVIRRLYVSMQFATDIKTIRVKNL